jgi:hypothetical protein
MAAEAQEIFASKHGIVDNGPYTQSDGTVTRCLSLMVGGTPYLATYLVFEDDEAKTARYRAAAERDLVKYVSSMTAAKR